MNTQVVLVGLYRYLNIPTRILRPLIDKLEGVNAHTIFYKNYDVNIFSLPSPKEEEIFVDTIKQLNPQIVGISVLSPYVEIAKRLTYLIIYFYSNNLSYIFFLTKGIDLFQSLLHRVLV